jgi:thiopeptide-type bacteriocin biosynthesis protein
MEGDKLKRDFILGDEWVYFKFFCGAQTADRIMGEAIAPIVNHLLKSDKINLWFFIRYSDPDLHLRVRLHISKPGSIGIIIRTMHKYIRKFVDHELIWKVQTDTYQREYERYGSYTMELSERLFFLDSSLFLNILPLLRNQQGEIQRWHFALKSVDCLLDCFNFNVEKKQALLEKLKDNFGKEFGINRSLKDQLNSKFAIEWKRLERSLNPKTENESIIEPLLGHLKSHKEKLALLANEINDVLLLQPLEVAQNDLIGSYIHMMMNRIFRSKQRIHELVLYDFLCRYYKSVIARTKKASEALQQLG